MFPRRPLLPLGEKEGEEFLEVMKELIELETTLERENTLRNDSS